MKNKQSLFALTVLALLLFMIGCEKTENPIKPDIGNFLSIIPMDNSTNIKTDEVISLQFAAPVDAKVIENGFGIISTDDIADSLCPSSKSMDHSDMNKAMMDTTMMNHFQMQHCVKGQFSWNSDKTVCFFKTDAKLKPNTEYMVYLNPSMVNQMKQVMMNNGMMNHGMGMMNCDCSGKGLDKDFIISHFKTMND